MTNDTTPNLVQQTKIPDGRPILGFKVLLKRGVEKMVCHDCIGNRDDSDVAAIAGGSPAAYGEEVPYPNCDECGNSLKPRGE